MNKKKAGFLPAQHLIEMLPPFVNQSPSSVKSGAASLKPNALPPGSHPAFARLKSQPGVFRCKLRPETNKARPEHSDYSGTLLMAKGERANVRLWVHADGSLGLRVALAPRKEAPCP
jgi:hypothetical protein